MQRNIVCASELLSTKDMNMRPSQDLCEIIGRFLVVGESVVAHWVEYAKGSFFLLELPDCVFGGYSTEQMRSKIREFRLLELAENPAKLAMPGRLPNSLGDLRQAV
jgi:hypothetical protein